MGYHVHSITLISNKEACIVTVYQTSSIGHSTIHCCSLICQIQIEVSHEPITSLDRILTVALREMYVNRYTSLNTREYESTRRNELMCENASRYVSSIYFTLYFQKRFC